MPELVLRVLAGNAKGAELRIVDELLLGRSAGRPGNLENDPTLSRRHARLRLTADDQLELEDLGSHNGTYVNGRRVGTPVRLARGDRIEIGQTTLELVVLADPPAPDAAVTRYARAVPAPPAAPPPADPQITRLAQAGEPPRAPPPADPQVTRLAQAAEPPRAAPPADPQVTRLAQVGQPPRAAPPADPQVTRLAQAGQPPPAAPPADPQVTRLARVAEEPPPAADPQVTRPAGEPAPAPVRAPAVPEVTRVARAVEEVGGQPTRLAQVPVEPAPEVGDDEAAEPAAVPAARRPWWKRLLRR